MSPRTLHSISGGQSAAPRDQMSQSSAFAPHGGRGRSAQAMRRVQALPVIEISRDEAMEFWAGVMRRRCGNPETCAVMFGVTVQTARNWFTAFSRPHIDVVLQAMHWWPDDFSGADLGQGR